MESGPLEVNIWTLRGCNQDPGGWNLDPGLFTSGPLEVGIKTHGGWNLDPCSFESGPLEVGSWTLEVGMWTPGGGNLDTWRLESGPLEVGSRPGKLQSGPWRLESGTLTCSYAPATPRPPDSATPPSRRLLRRPRRSFSPSKSLYPRRHGIHRQCIGE